MLTKKIYKTKFSNHYLYKNNQKLHLLYTQKQYKMIQKKTCNKSNILI